MEHGLKILITLKKNVQKLSFFFGYRLRYFIFVDKIFFQIFNDLEYQI